MSCFRTRIKITGYRHEAQLHLKGCAVQLVDQIHYSTESNLEYGHEISSRRKTPVKPRNLLNAIIRPFGYVFERIPTDRRPEPDLTIITGQIVASIRAQTNGVVWTGPFCGLKMTGRNPWSSYDEPSRLLGSYEQELSPALEAAIAENPDTVINIGAGDGYYAVDLALRLPDAKVIAFDISRDCQKATRECAALNGVEGRLEIRGQCEASDLADIIAGRQALIVSDCEGYEEKLFTADNLDALRHSSIIVECHSTQQRITKLLTQLFSETHHVEVIREGARDPNLFLDLATKPSLERWIAMCEFRPMQMEWIYAAPKTASLNPHS